MRSGTGTKAGDPGCVTFSTKPTIDCLAGPSFQEGKGVGGERRQREAEYEKNE